MKMPQIAHAIALSTVFTLFGFALAAPADAVKLRRPYNENITFNYGFDNNYGSAGCTDFNCGGHCYNGHTGTDHAMPVGTNLVAGEDGTVSAVSNGCNNYGYYGNTCGGRCGNYVKIRHDDGQYSLYCHMKRGSNTVSVGQRVSCGQKIGESASSGSSTGPHLHLAWQSGGTSRDSFRGSCTSSPGVWRQQNGYREPVGKSCGCVPSDEVCDGKDNNCNGEVDEDEVCEQALLKSSPNSYAPPGNTDINGDGLQDICGRYASGWGCYLATGDGWSSKVSSGQMTDDGGWDKVHYYATIRTGDVDGDGLADVCGRHSTRGYQCWRSTGDGFEHYANAPGYTNADGWTDPGYYTTFRLSDINGDGKDDVCARGPQGWSCQLSTGDGFGETVAGPAWTDESGYKHAWYFGTIRTGDINGDAKQDVCIRRAAGFDCYVSTGTSFERHALIENFNNEGGWKAQKYWSTLSLIDYDGDAKADVCARFYSGFRCMKATDSGFEAAEEIVPVNDAMGWDTIDHYLTIRAGDLNADGKQNICVRGKEGIDCFSDSGAPITGPRWKDSSGWTKPWYYTTIMVTDIDPDRRRDICARAAAGLICSRSGEDGFASLPALDSFSNENGWEHEKYYSTLRMGAGTCSAELCNGFDDDCDGQIDEGSPSQMGHFPPAIAAKFIDATLPEAADIGTVVEATVRFENVGSAAWDAGQISLEAVAEAEALEALRPPSGWIDTSVAATLADAVAPGAIATLTFSLRVPADAATFEQVLFALNADDAPIACPAPSATLGMGVTTPGEEDPQDNNTPGNPGRDAGFGAPDGGYADADAPDRDSTLRSASSSSCACSSTDNPSSPLSTAFWPGLLMMTLFWTRRRSANASSIRALMGAGVLLMMGIALIGCEAPAPPAQGQAVAHDEPSAEALNYVPVPHADEPNDDEPNTDEAPGSAPNKAPELDLRSTRLLGAYAGWELRGQPLPLLPHSDQPPSMVVALSYQGEAVDWPLGGEPISNAVFVPSAQGQPTTVAVRTPDARLLLVELGKKAAHQAVEVDRNLGLSVAAAENGCCLVYMRGEMGFQDSLTIMTLADDRIHEVKLSHNAWSPAISPDGRQVVYVAPSANGSPALYGLDLDDAAPESPTQGHLLIEQMRNYPAGPQPPFWTAQGIAFAAENGAYRMNQDGHIFEGAPGARGLVLDLSSGAMLDSAGQTLRFDKLK